MTILQRHEYTKWWHKASKCIVMFFWMKEWKKVEISKLYCYPVCISIVLVHWFLVGNDVAITKNVYHKSFVLERNFHLEPIICHYWRRSTLTRIGVLRNLHFWGFKFLFLEKCFAIGKYLQREIWTTTFVIFLWINKVDQYITFCFKFQIL